MLIFDPSLGGYTDAVKAACVVLCERLPRAQRGKKPFPESLYQKLSEFLTQTVDPTSDEPAVAQAHAVIPPYAVIGHDPTTTAWAYTGGVCIWLGDRPFKDKNSMRLPAVLLHELIHVACGGELDSETVENFLFRNEGAATLTKDDFEDFISCRFRGRWYRVVKERENATEALIKNSENTLVFTIKAKVGEDRLLPDPDFMKVLELIPVEK